MAKTLTPEEAAEVKSLQAEQKALHEVVKEELAHRNPGISERLHDAREKLADIAQRLNEILG